MAGTVQHRKPAGKGLIKHLNQMKPEKQFVPENKRFNPLIFIFGMV